MKYPRPLTKKEREEVKEEQEKDNLDAVFSKMYKLREDAEDD